MASTTRGTYYVGRVNKRGSLDSDGIIQAILAPPAIVYRGSAWTFIDAQRVKDITRDFVFARLSKYSPDAEVRVVDPQRRQEVRRSEPNLSIAASPFIFIPTHAGVAFLRVAQHIEPHIFAARFGEIIEAAFRGFFVGCDVEFITDLRTFAAKLSSLQRIVRLKATVHPPNPLFGPLWKSLADYMEGRDVETLQHEEDAGPDASLKTDLPAHVQAAAEQTEGKPYVPHSLPPIGDAAILMAADGYGEGLVQGKSGDTTLIIRTAETIKNFSFPRDPEPAALHDEAISIFEEIERQRHMEPRDGENS